MFDFFHKKKSTHSFPDASGVSPAHQKASVPTTQEVLSEFTSIPFPDAIDGLLFRVSMANPDLPSEASGFERYAARLLSEANASSIREIAVKHPMELRYLNSSRIFWVVFDETTISTADHHRLLRVESILDRLSLTSHAFSAERGDLPPEEIVEELCSDFDQFLLRTVADNASTFLAASDHDNKLCTQYGATAARGGNWDLSTRFAVSCEAMVLPYRLEYRFVCDASTNTIVADISTPEPCVFPGSRFDEDTQAWKSCENERPAMATTYALRLTALVAAAAFGSSVGIKHVFLNVRSGSLKGDVVMAVEYDRIAFTMGTMTNIRHKLLSQPETCNDVNHILSFLHAKQALFNADEAGNLQPIKPLIPHLAVPYVPLAEDTRALPSSLKGLLHADSVRDLDVMTEQDPALAARYRSIINEKDDSLLLAVAQLEDIVAETDKTLVKNIASDDTTKPNEQFRVLYCENVFARYLTSLVEPNESVRYVRASDIGQAARSSLSRIYRDIGDLNAAEAQAKVCIDIAPTSPPAYNDLICCYAEASNYEKIIDLVKSALRVAVTGTDIAYLYYRLAFAYWQTGCLEEALACYLRVPLDTPMGEAASHERNDLMAEMGSHLPDSEWDPETVLRTASVPLAPLDTTMEVVGKALIELCDANMPVAAAPLATLVATEQCNDALHAVAGSLRQGV